MTDLNKLEELAGFLTNQISQLTKVRDELQTEIQMSIASLPKPEDINPSKDNSCVFCEYHTYRYGGNICSIKNLLITDIAKRCEKYKEDLPF